MGINIKFAIKEVYSAKRNMKIYLESFKEVLLENVKIDKMLIRYRRVFKVEK